MTTRSRDHTERALARLTFKDKLIVEAALKSLTDRVQELEDAAWEIIELRSIDDAEGVQLDILGSLVGRGRNGLNDDRYKLAIKTQIRINRSQGLTKDMTDVLQLATPAGVALAFYEPAAATMLIEVGPGDYDQDTLVKDLLATKAGGVKLFLVFFEVADGAFMWSAEPGGIATPDDERGWSSVTAITIGGRWSHVL